MTHTDDALTEAVEQIIFDEASCSVTAKGWETFVGQLDDVGNAAERIIAAVRQHDEQAAGITPGDAREGGEGDEY